MKSGRRERPFVISLQHYSLNHYPTRLVAPLATDGAIVPVGRMTPLFEVNGQKVRLSPTEIATFAIRYLGTPITNLESERDRIVAALDLVFLGI
ncbi:MAG TPA: CcdB family protein [Rhizomicrobium sp.]|nr:CcdB family protein [Rhizomicrobium sp.]